MKKFTIKVGKNSYSVFGKDLESVEGFENGIPKIWQENKDKIVEEDMTEKNKEREEVKAELEKISNLLQDKKVRKAIISQYEGFKKPVKEETKSKARGK